MDDEDDSIEPQSFEEIQAQLGDGSAVDYAWAFLIALSVDPHDWGLAMSVMTDEFRRLHAVAWVDRAIATGQVSEGDRDRDATIDALSEIVTVHPKWSEFAEANLLHYDILVGSIFDDLAVGSRPRPVGVDAEAYHFVLYSAVQADQVELGGDTVAKLIDGGPIPAALRWS